MGLPLALKAHKEGDLAQAESQYKRALSQNVENPVVYQNYGALLRSLSRFDEAKKIYCEGVIRFPEHKGILRNYANLLRKSGDIAYSIELYLEVLKKEWSEEHLSKDFDAVFDDLADTLRQNGMDRWLINCIKRFLLLGRRPSPVILKNLLILSTQNDLFRDDETTQQLLLKAVKDIVDSLPLLDAVNLDFAMAAYYLQQRDLSSADTVYQQALRRIQLADQIPEEDHDELRKLIDINSWNYACITLPLQNFKKGWQLYEHGLRTPAEGQQRWQRALPKPFSHSELPLWRGESGAIKRLLLLEEQAIGDAMMFITLVPTLLEEFKFIGLFVSERLLPIYRRSFESEIKDGVLCVFSKNDLDNGVLKASDFDVQSPLGSICQYRFTELDAYAPRSPILQADISQAANLRQQYLRGRGAHNSVSRLIGISWCGGGRGKRIQEKSINTTQFGKFLARFPHIRFVNLQYGNTSQQVQQWLADGVNLVHDNRINPLKDMDGWLSQVEACDAVLSVANTTIHGAGGVNKPTLCLLSLFADWRWLADPSITTSYWYPSVQIARQNKESGWDDALRFASDWLERICE